MPCLRLAGLVLMPLLFVVQTGCDSSKAKVTYAEVEGAVTLNGKAVPGAEVTFYPITEGTDALPYATGRTDETGHYRLIVNAKQSGAVVGKSRAVVNWPARERSEDKGAPQKPPFDIPLRYTVASQSPLQVEVLPTSPNKIDLAMTAP